MFSIFNDSPLEEGVRGYQRVGRVVPNAGLKRLGSLLRIQLRLLQRKGGKHLSHGDVEGIERPLPELAEQTAIAEVLTEMDAELAGLEQRREKTRALKQAMMQELLTGRTRLVSVKEAHA